MYSEELLAPWLAVLRDRLPSLDVVDMHVHVGLSDPGSRRPPGDRGGGTRVAGPGGRPRVVFPLKEPGGYREANECVPRRAPPRTPTVCGGWDRALRGHRRDLLLGFHGRAAGPGTADDGHRGAVGVVTVVFSHDSARYVLELVAAAAAAVIDVKGLHDAGVYPSGRLCRRRVGHATPIGCVRGARRPGVIHRGTAGYHASAASESRRRPVAVRAPASEGIRWPAMTWVRCTTTP
jgi:hypothetical protein